MPLPAIIGRAVAQAALRSAMSSALRGALGGGGRRVAIREVGDALRKKATELAREVARAEQDSAQDALRIARELSSGTLSTRQQRAMGHPYSRRRPQLRHSAFVVNRQSGRFRAGWRIQRAGNVTRLVNDSPEAKFMTAQGTKRMIGRPIQEAIRARLLVSRTMRIARAVGKGLSR